MHISQKKCTFAVSKETMFGRWKKYIEAGLHSRQIWLLALVSTYCVLAVMMNYLCMKPISFGTSFIWMDGGLLISWLVFLIANVIVEAYDKQTAIFVSGIATVLALLVSLLGVAEVHIPSLPQYSAQADHFAHVFSNGPRTIVSSAVAFFISNVVNVEIIAAYRHQGTRLIPFWGRAVISTIVGQMVDNTLFQVLAFAPVGWSLYEMYWRDIWTAVGMSTAFETVVEALFVPLITLPLSKYLTGLKD